MSVDCRVRQYEAPFGMARATEAQHAACYSITLSSLAGCRFAKVPQSAEAAGKLGSARVVAQQQTL